MRNRALRIVSGLGGVVAILAITPSVGFAQDYVPTAQDYLNNIWVFIAGVLVFFMQAGFALLDLAAIVPRSEAGRSVNGWLVSARAESGR